MKKTLMLYRASLTGQISYKKNMILELVIWFIYSIIPLIAVNLFLKGSVASNNNVSMLVHFMYGSILVAYNFARMFARGLDNYQQLLFSGDLDIYFTRPLSIIYQVIISEIFIRRISGIIVGIISILESYRQGFELSIIATLYLILILGITYIGLMLIAASILTITTEGTMLASILVDSSANIGFYPTTLLKNPAKFIYTFIVPIYFCLYLPVDLIGNSDIVFLGYIYPFFTMVLVNLMGICMFNYMLLKYQSNNR
ncbi:MULTISPECIES: ABC-2 family transporter protein [Terrabacteria group]|uniref:ABC-2 family transporter protein n=1 Tax=Bacillati TaxID=1783272 RepID=UPI001C6F32AB|nr:MULTISPECIES: ABC-2 family transporter protein [Terrabacteria group]MBW9211978.1 ABC-2 family transporter protein [Trueperella sp. zg.1013]